MPQRDYRPRGAARAQAMPQSQAPWVLAMLTAAGIVLLGISLAHSQSAVPDVVRPTVEAPAAPPAPPRPIPESGVIPPPSTAATTPVIRPPTTGGMPVIAPPGSAGGDRSVVPK